MTELEPVAMVELPNPVTGELVPLEHPVEVAAEIDRVELVQLRLSDYLDMLKGLLIEESRRQGMKTLRLGEYLVEIKGGYQTFPDLERLCDLLRQAGLPDDRCEQLVKQKIAVTEVVDRNVLKSIRSANTTYADAIDRAEGPPTRLTVTVKKA